MKLKYSRTVCMLYKHWRVTTHTVTEAKRIKYICTFLSTCRTQSPFLKSFHFHHFRRGGCVEEILIWSAGWSESSTCDVIAGVGRTREGRLRWYWRFWEGGCWHVLVVNTRFCRHPGDLCTVRNVTKAEGRKSGSAVIICFCWCWVWELQRRQCHVTAQHGHWRDAEYINLVPSSEWLELYLVSPIRLHGVNRDSFICT
jgi:hypothetical protein